ncbi:MAG: hypothetical protein AB1798_11920, partial [Spirochaetota bacterium]
NKVIEAFSDQSADINGDGIVSVDELKDYVSKTIPEYTRYGKSGPQHPTVDRDNIYQKFGFPVLSK